MINLLVIRKGGFEQEIWERVYLDNCHNPQLGVKLANEAVMTFRDNQPGLWVSSVQPMKGYGK